MGTSQSTVVSTEEHCMPHINRGSRSPITAARPISEHQHHLFCSNFMSDQRKS